MGKIADYLLMSMFLYFCVVYVYDIQFRALNDNLWYHNQSNSQYYNMYL